MFERKLSPFRAKSSPDSVERSGFHYVYDPAGNIASKQVEVPESGSTMTPYSHNSLNQINGLGRASGAAWESARMLEGDHRYLWAGGNQPAEQRAADGTSIIKRYFPQGEQRIGGSDAGFYYYTKDHLGSVREITNSGGALVTRYDFDLWGKRTKLSGSMETEVGFTGHDHHSKSGLVLTWFRAYDAEMGRWLSADPIGEAGGLNLYGYVENEPISYIDELGAQRSRGLGRFLPLSRAGSDALSKGGPGAHGQALAAALRCARNTNQALKSLGSGAYRLPNDKNTKQLLNLNKNGGMAAAQNQFDEIAKAVGGQVRTYKTPKGTVQSVDLPGGGKCTLRDFGTSAPSRPTIDLHGRME